MENDSLLPPPPPPPPQAAQQPAPPPYGSAPPYTGAPTLPVPTKSHVMRNVLLGIGGFVVLLIVIGLITVVSVMNGMKNSQATQLAVRTAAANPQVIAITGSPLAINSFVSGSINTDTGGGRAMLGIPVAGPTGSGALSVNEERVNGAWRIWRMTFRPSGGAEPISIVDSSPENPANL